MVSYNENDNNTNNYLTIIISDTFYPTCGRNIEAVGGYAIALSTQTSDIIPTDGQQCN